MNSAIFFISSILIFSPFIAEAGISDAEINEKVTQLNAAPYWGQINDENISTLGPKLMRVIEPLKSWNINDVRILVKRLSMETSGEEKWRAWNDIYIINRYCINVPQEANINSVKKFGAWYVPMNRGTGNYNILYPLTMTLDGRLQLIGGSRLYNGSSYDVLGEFDYLLKIYGKRTN